MAARRRTARCRSRLAPSGATRQFPIRQGAGPGEIGRRCTLSVLIAAKPRSSRGSRINRVLPVSGSVTSQMLRRSASPDPNLRYQLLRCHHAVATHSIRRVARGPADHGRAGRGDRPTAYQEHRPGARCVGGRLRLAPRLRDSDETGLPCDDGTRTSHGIRGQRRGYQARARRTGRPVRSRGAQLWRFHHHPGGCGPARCRPRLRGGACTRRRRG